MRTLARAPRYALGLARAAVDIGGSAAVIVRRELVGLLRTRRLFWLSLLTVLAAGLLPLLVWPAPGSATAPLRGARTAFDLYVGAVRVAVCLCVTVVAAGVITTERERGTYEALYMTALRPSGLILGKLIASCGYFLLLFVLTFPFGAALFLLGGFELREFTDLAIDVVWLVGYLALVALWGSISSRNTQEAISKAVGLHLFLLFVAGILSSLLGLFLGLRPAIGLLLGVAAVIFWFALLGAAPYPTVPPARKKRRTRSTRRGPVTESAGGPRDSVTARRALRRRSTILSRPLVTRCAGGIPDGWNPAFALTLLALPLGEAKSRRALLVVAIFLLCLVSLPVIFGEPAINHLAVVGNLLFLWYLAVVPAALSASGLASEEKCGMSALLRDTPLAVGTVARGKLLATLFLFSGVAALAIAFNVTLVIVASVLGPQRDAGTALSMAVVAIPALPAVACVSVTAGLLAAAVCRHRLPALLLALLLTAGALVVPFTLWELPLSPLVEASRTAFGGPVGSPVARMAVALAVSLCVGCLQYALAVAQLRLASRRARRTGVA